MTDSAFQVSNFAHLAELDRRALAHARKVHRRAHRVRNSAFTGSWTECMFSNAGNFTAVASTNAEATMLAGINEQPIFQPQFWMSPSATRRAFRVIARGYFSTTGTPTMTFTGRLGTTVSSSFLTGTTIFASAAITTGSGVSNKSFELVVDGQLRTPGLSTSNTTLLCQGFARSPGGFASPFEYALTPGAGDSTTVTATIDGSATQYFNLTLTWSASSASNTATLTQLLCLGYN